MHCLTNVQEIIKKLKSIPLNQDNIEQYSIEYNKLGFIGIIETHLHPGKNIFRSRINEANESFTSAAQISYPPKPSSIFGRANCPNVGMFYGTYTPSEVTENEIDAAYLVNAFEICPFLRDSSSIGETKITIGKWQVTNEIRLATIIFHKDFQNKTRLANSLNEDFMEYINNHSQYKEETILWNNFISSEFAKPVEEVNSINYIISATYTDFFIRKGFDGIIYPTVKLEGRGLNIALKTTSVDSCLQLRQVAEGKFYKKEKKTVMDWERICEVNNPDLLEFKDDVNQLGETFCKKMISEL